MGCIRCETVCTTGSISYISTVSTSRSQRLTIGATTSVPGDTAECCSVSEISTSCYFTPLIPAEESIPIATAPDLVLFQLRSVGILCQTTRCHTKRLISVQFHTHNFDQHLHRQNHVKSELPAPL